MPAVQAPLAMGDLSDQQEFFRDLVAEIRSLRQENHDLKDQIGETNRDLMKLEFRVDTHSESFRPLNLTAEPEDTTYDDGPGVLPPRAEPVGSFNE
jgi:predicted RNase H-like nuclease (RuvC/YqgF family)